MFGDFFKKTFFEFGNLFDGMAWLFAAILLFAVLVTGIVLLLAHLFLGL